MASLAYLRMAFLAILHSYPGFKKLLLFPPIFYSQNYCFYNFLTELKIGQKFIEKWRVFGKSKACGQKVFSGMTILKWKMPKLRFIIMENCFCTFDKFWGLLEF